MPLEPVSAPTELFAAAIPCSPPRQDAQPQREGAHTPPLPALHSKMQYGYQIGEVRAPHAHSQQEAFGGYGTSKHGQRSSRNRYPAVVNGPQPQWPPATMAPSLYGPQPRWPSAPMAPSHRALYRGHPACALAQSEWAKPACLVATRRAPTLDVSDRLGFHHQWLSATLMHQAGTKASQTV
jgi:hypothetical protein